jgi:predicted DNA-binding transcriptional regulator AlpA
MRREVEQVRGDHVPVMLTTGEVARALKVAPSTLCRWRTRGIGPRVYWLGEATPRYRQSDVMAWLEQVAA